MVSHGFSASRAHTKSGQKLHQTQTVKGCILGLSRWAKALPIGSGSLPQVSNGARALSILSSRKMWNCLNNYTSVTDDRMIEINEASTSKIIQRLAHRLNFLLPVIGACFLMASCAASDLPLMSVADANSGLVQGYRIAGGDKLKVTVFDEPTLTGEFAVGLDGSLSLPLITSMQATGQTPNELSAKITSALAAGGYVLSPRVSVEVSQHRPFYILGEVNAPGEYPYIGDLTVDQAIAKAEGYSPRANKSEVVLRRQGWTEGRRVRLNAGPLLIAPGDTILVQEAFF